MNEIVQKVFEGKTDKEWNNTENIETLKEMIVIKERGGNIDINHSLMVLYAIFAVLIWNDLQFEMS